jgi:hypothetical protein
MDTFNNEAISIFRGAKTHLLASTTKIAIGFHHPFSGLECGDILGAKDLKPFRP